MFCKIFNLLGSYLYVGFNDTSSPKSQRSRIYSPKRPASVISNCVTFYYHIYNVSKLSFNTYLATDNGLSDPQWTMTISQGLLWHGARFSVAPKSVSWQVSYLEILKLFLIFSIITHILFYMQKTRSSSDAKLQQIIELCITLSCFKTV